ncbi:MAG: hypothetical protein ACRCX2_38050 [Paraclostridium sp.]
MYIAKIQSELKNNGVTYRGYELLQYLKKTYFQDFRGVDLQRLRPLQFGESKYVKQAFDELVNAQIISGEYKLGVAKNIVPNIAILNSIDDIGVSVTVVKEKKAPAKKSSDIPDAIKDILLHYNSHASLPRPSTPTPLVIGRIEEQLRVHPPESIKLALDVASKATWLVNKGSEKWCNAAWVFNVVHEFMDGGKYYETNTPPSPRNVVVESNDVEVFW